ARRGRPAPDGGAVPAAAAQTAAGAEAPLRDRHEPEHALRPGRPRPGPARRGPPGRGARRVRAGAGQAPPDGVRARRLRAAEHAVRPRHVPRGRDPRLGVGASRPSGGGSGVVRVDRARPPSGARASPASLLRGVRGARAVVGGAAHHDAGALPRPAGGRRAAGAGRGGRETLAAADRRHRRLGGLSPLYSLTLSRLTNPSHTRVMLERLHGRAAELEAVRLLFDAARAGDGGSLVLAGPPGIGKTALLGRAGSLADGFTVLRARGVAQEARLPASGLHALLRPVAGPARSPVLARTLLGAAEGGMALHAAVLEFLAGLAAAEPVLVCVDDFHLLDDVS